MSAELDQPEAEGYGLVMPFVVVRSEGGPFDDDAFVAGWAAGAIDRTLEVVADEAAVRELTFTVRTSLLPQLELIGMRHQFPVLRCTATDATPEWTFITYARTGAAGVSS